MRKIWILFSYQSGWSEVKSFHNIFWEEPHLKSLREYFTFHKKKTSEVLDYDFIRLIRGEKVPMYGETYFIEMFPEPFKKEENEKIYVNPGGSVGNDLPQGGSNDPGTLDDMLYNLESAADGV